MNTLIERLDKETTRAPNVRPIQVYTGQTTSTASQGYDSSSSNPENLQVHSPTAHPQIYTPQNRFFGINE